MDEKQLTRLKAEYMSIKIPEGYDMAVNKAMTTGRQRPARSLIIVRRAAVALAGVVLAFAVSLNALPAFAQSLQDVPVLGPIVKVLTLARFSASSEEQAYSVDVVVPEIEGLEDANLQASLNDRYLTEGQSLYAVFMQEVGGLQEGELAHKALDAGYKVKVKTDDLLVVEHWVVVTMASGAESVTYDNIDLQNQVLVTLPSLFVDDRYVAAISENITRQMREQMEATSQERFFFVDEFKGIAPDQTFYISADHKLMIVFNEYEVAPGSMGVVEFEVPTEAIAEFLVGSGYIR